YQKTLRIASNIAYIYEHFLMIYFHLCSVWYGGLGNRPLTSEVNMTGCFFVLLHCFFQIVFDYASEGSLVRWIE
ncbi:MAG: hypothetical protein AB7Y74_15510, partial [Syntrophorhabdus sp.]